MQQSLVQIFLQRFKFFCCDRRGKRVKKEKKKQQKMLKKSAKQQQQKRRAIDFFQAPPYRVSYAGLHVLHLYPTLPRPLTCPIPRSLPSSLPLLIVDIVGPKETLSWGCVSPLQLQHSSGFSSRCLCKFTTAARMMPHSSACCCTFILAIPRLDS